jgi:hypothetical protein
MYYRMAEEQNSRWERRTWPELKRLTEEVPEAGIHFQSNGVHPFFTFFDNSFLTQLFTYRGPCF